MVSKPHQTRNKKCIQGVFHCFMLDRCIYNVYIEYIQLMIIKAGRFSADRNAKRAKGYLYGHYHQQCLGCAHL